MFVNSDFSDLLKIFNDNEVKYLVVGGYALIQHGEPRATKALDLWIATGEKNAIAVFNALKIFGSPLKDLTYGDFSETGYFYQMGYPPVRIDLMMGIPGVEFEFAWRQRMVVDFEDLPVNFISREDLIKSKIASGRPQDLLDAKTLTSTSI